MHSFRNSHGSPSSPVASCHAGFKLRLQVRAWVHNAAPAEVQPGADSASQTRPGIQPDLTNGTESLDTGINSGLDEDKAGLLSWWDGQGQRWDTRAEPRTVLWFCLINLITKPYHPICGSLECFPCNSVKEPHFYQQHLEHNIELEQPDIKQVSS